MTFPVELDVLEKGLVFKLREGEPVFVEARPLNESFDMTFEDRSYGSRDLYGGRPEERYGSFIEQLDVEITRRGLIPEIANGYLEIGPETEISKETTIYGNHSSIKRPRVVRQKIQLYSLDGEVARNQRIFVTAFVMTWSS
jgi:hypothetical protein